MFNHKNVDLTFFINTDYVDFQNNLDGLIMLVDHVISTFTENRNITEEIRQQNISRLLFIRRHFIEQRNQQQQNESHAVPRPR